MSLYKLTIVIFCALVLTISCTEKQEEIKKTAKFDFTPLEKYLKDSADVLKGKGDGFCLLIIKDGREIFNHSYGNFDENTVVPIASSSKWLSAGLILALENRGILSVTDKLSKYFPDIDESKKDITIEQLFANTSGFPTLDSVMMSQTLSIEEVVDSALKLELSSAPGAEFAYGGISMQIGGRVAEIASGLNWNETLAKYLCVPLEMNNTKYFTGKAGNPRIASSAMSSARDYAHYLEMLINGGEYNGKKILSRPQVDYMLSDLTHGAPITFSFYKFFGNVNPKFPGLRYGLGCWREKIDEQTGEILVANSVGAFGFAPWIDLENNMLAVFASNNKLQPMQGLKLLVPKYYEMKKIMNVIVEDKPDAADKK